MEKEHFVGSLYELKQIGGRKRLNVCGKDIFIILYKDSVFALDSFCYHAGGPLYLGDIEDIDGHTCIICPWHKYKLTLQSGEGLYHSVDPHNMKQPPVLCSKGVKQRTHTVTLKGDFIYVTLSDKSSGAPTLESDQYNKRDTAT